MLIKPQFVVGVVLLISSISFAQTNQGQQRNRLEEYSIRGKLIVQNQHDFDQRVEIKLEKAALQVVQTTYTDSAGNFEFRGLGPGSYFVAITVEGYEPIHQSVEVFNSFGNSSLTLFLNKSSETPRDRLSGVDAADPDVVDISQMKENFPKKALQDYEKALEEKKKGKLDAAVKLLEEAIQIAPTFFHAHNNLGTIYHLLKRYPDAEREFKRSRQLNAKSEGPLVNLGSLYIDESNLQKSDKEASGKLLDEALDSLEEAVKLNPRSAVAYFLLGQANYRSDFLEEAETAFKKAYSLDPHLAVSQLMLANVYVKLQKWDAVLETLDAYLKDNPKATDRASVEEMRSRIARTAQREAEKQQ